MLLMISKLQKYARLVIAKVIACPFTSSVSFPDFILRGEVRGTSIVMGMGKILSPPEAFLTFFNFRGRCRFPAPAMLIKFAYRCFDRILLNGLIQPFQQPERVIGFFNALMVVSRISFCIIA